MATNRTIDLAQVRRYGNLEFLARQMVEGFITGLHKSPYHGFSVEFAEHKIYNTGETTRHIDWKIYAKTDRLYTKRYEEETNLRCQILIDTSSSMYYPSENAGKLVFSTAAAASLIWMLQRQRDAVGITTFDEAIGYQSPVKSTGSHVHQLFASLEGLLQSQPQNRPTRVAPALHQIADRMNRRSLIVLFSDVFSEEPAEEVFSALQHLKHNLHEILIFHVFDGKTELNFDFEDRPYEFIDLESGQRLKLRPNEVKAAYQQGVSDYFKELKMKCHQYKIDFIEADINQPIDQVLLPYLVKRTKMR